MHEENEKGEKRKRQKWEEKIREMQQSSSSEKLWYHIEVWGSKMYDNDNGVTVYARSKKIVSNPIRKESWMKKKRERKSARKEKKKL